MAAAWGHVWKICSHGGTSHRSSERLTQPFLPRQEILNALDTSKALVVSLNVSSKAFLQPGSGGSKELHDGAGQLRLHWDAARAAVESWREGLRQSLMQCQVRHHSRRRRPTARPTWVGGADIFSIVRLLWHSQMGLVLGNVLYLPFVSEEAHLLSHGLRLPGSPALLPGPLIL